MSLRWKFALHAEPTDDGLDEIVDGIDNRSTPQPHSAPAITTYSKINCINCVLNGLRRRGKNGWQMISNLVGPLSRIKKLTSGRFSLRRNRAAHQRILYHAGQWRQRCFARNQLHSRWTNTGPQLVAVCCSACRLDRGVDENNYGERSVSIRLGKLLSPDQPCICLFKLKHRLPLPPAPSPASDQVFRAK